MESQKTLGIPFWASLQFNLVVYMVLLVVLPLVGVLLIALPRMQDYNQTEIVQRLETTAQLKTNQIDDWLSEGQSDLRLLLADADRQAQFVDLLTAPTEDQASAINTLFADLIASQNNYNRLFLYDPQGEILAASTPSDLGKNVTRQPYFSASLTTEGYIQPPIYQIGTQDLAIFITHPVYDPAGEVVGVLAASLQIETLTRIMQEAAGFPGSGETYLVSLQNRYFLTPSRFEGYPPNRAYNSTGITNVLDGENGWAIYDDYRTPAVSVIGVYRWIPALEAGLLAEVNEAEAIENSNTLRDTTLLVAGLAILIAAIFGVIYSLYVTRPITALTRASVALAQGDYSKRVTVLRRNEIGQLASTFNSMSAELQHNIEQLEERVAVRTRDLQIASQVSRRVTQVLDRQQLLNEFVETTKQSFNLYHVSVFTYDGDQRLVLEAGAGDAGKQMLADGKQFNLEDQGLVPLAGRTRTAIVSDDVTTTPDHHANPLLPDTHAEVAIPMLIGDILIGVLDLQASEVQRFSKEDINLLTTLAEQIAIAMRNAQLFEDVQSARTEAERANSVKSYFLASVSHELRTPLNAIINFTRFMLKGRMGPVTEKQEEALTTVAESGKHLLNLINDVLDISKIESGSLELYIEDNIDLTKEIKTAVDASQTLLAAKPVQLTTELDPNLPLITGDRQRILQVMLNLLSNACKFTQEGSVKLHAYPQNGDVIIAVKDTGPGIAEEEHAAVFESFRQTTTGLRQGGGTGLGMPISKRLIEAHGGKLWLESTVGTGTTFYVTLPVKSETLKPLTL